MTLELEDRLWAQLEAAADRPVRRRVRPSAGLRPGAALAVLAAACAALVVALAPEHAGPSWRLDPVGVRGSHLSAGVGGHGSVWSYDARSGSVLRLDPETRRVLARIPLAGAPGEAALASDADAVWAIPSAPIRHSAPAPAHPRPATLVRIDPRTNRVTRVALRAPGGRTVTPVGVLAIPDAVWVWGEQGALRVDPARARVTASAALPAETFRGLTATDTLVSAVTDLGRLVTFDARTGRPGGAIELENAASAQKLVAVGDHVVLYRSAGTLASVDPRTGRARWSARTGSQPRDMVLSGGRLWVLLAEASGSELRALDPGDGHVLSRIALKTPGARTLAPAGAMPLVTTQDGTLISVRSSR